MSAQLPPLTATRLLDQVRERVRYMHYSLRTEQAYVYWVKAFVHFHGLRHPSTLGRQRLSSSCRTWPVIGRCLRPPIGKRCRP